MNINEQKKIFKKRMRHSTLKYNNILTNDKHSKISFVDLAGSEREYDKINVDKKTRIDGAAINQSLFSLKEFIRDLEHDKLHIQFLEVVN